MKLASVRPARTRALHRLHDHWAHLLQIGVGVLLAWLVAERLLGHTQPFFAPVTAILCLGLTYGQRLRRLVEVAVAVAIGVLVGDLIVAALGGGAWQMATVVVLAMGIATLVSSGQLLVIQAGVQSVFIVAFVSDQGVGVARWLDAVVGGLVALAIGAVAPTSPVRRPPAEACPHLPEGVYHHPHRVAPQPPPGPGRDLRLGPGLGFQRTSGRPAVRVLERQPQLVRRARVEQEHAAGEEPAVVGDLEPAAVLLGEVRGAVL